jgi:hypothetical protein
MAVKLGLLYLGRYAQEHSAKLSKKKTALQILDSGRSSLADLFII